MQSSRTMRRLMTVALMAVPVVAVAPGPAQAAPYRACSPVAINLRLSAGAIVLEAKRMSCRAARQVVRRYGKDYDSSQAFDRGGRFWLGNYRCTVYSATPAVEDWAATCAKNGHAFKVAYGA